MPLNNYILIYACVITKSQHKKQTNTYSSQLINQQSFNQSDVLFYRFNFPSIDWFRWQRGDIQRMLLAADQRRVRYVPLEVVRDLEKECKEADGLQPEIQGGLAFIYPGTKW